MVERSPSTAGRYGKMSTPSSAKAVTNAAGKWQNKYA
ncbi:hypothetical protein T11_552 [Trichinella zimbabwensis]|uniref:Uncharacterized protein n=1 Tax=Trichinella zimbabwensis TaxID=268475 RepID=A0A0V1GDI1_9BILA|nr:hypothetical protein T11_4590 [Trichinella zimbabwensis]KRY97826.1 hypothetical protein T11_552 [Trichinella zimbabwensis]